eukprot:TRINITY_DN256_c0_g1_i1.p2 TRINITY_DN256_c0_g1~~TRINITY_DN256_c0_g1_i1.p2  ORF type:complete len:156 (-),score=23.33 TRINITY_DN256_c0_g1_i1:243-710(-)
MASLAYGSLLCGGRGRHFPLVERVDQLDTPGARRGVAVHGGVKGRIGMQRQRGSGVPRRDRIVTAVGPASSPGGFLSMEEAGLVEMTPLEMHERFLARLTISSLNLLRVIAAEKNVPIEDLNAGLICDWFTIDQERRAKDIDSAVLKWESHPEDF